MTLLPVLLIGAATIAANLGGSFGLGVFLTLMAVTESRREAVRLLVATGFFGAEYMKSRRGSAPPPAATAAERVTRDRHPCREVGLWLVANLPPQTPIAFARSTGSRKYNREISLDGPVQLMAPSTASTSSLLMDCSRPVETATSEEFLKAPVAKALGAPS